MKKLSGLVSLLVLALTLAYGQVARADFGTNWSATFYPSDDLTGGGVLVTSINGINFNWGSGAPVVNGAFVPISGCPVSASCADHFSVRFTAIQYFSPGTYQFVTSSDDGIRVYIDGVLMLDKFIVRPATVDTFDATLFTGLHNLVVEYFDNIDQASVQVQWFLQQTESNTAAPVRDFYPTKIVPLSWTRISWATGYEIEVATTQAFGATRVDHDDTLRADTLATITLVPDNGLYYWRVRAKKANGVDWGNWSAIQSFTANGP